MNKFRHFRQFKYAKSLHLAWKLIVAVVVVCVNLSAWYAKTVKLKIKTVPKYEQIYHLNHNVCEETECQTLTARNDGQTRSEEK